MSGCITPSRTLTGEEFLTLGYAYALSAPRSSRAAIISRTDTKCPMKELNLPIWFRRPESRSARWGKREVCALFPAYQSGFVDLHHPSMRRFHIDQAPCRLAGIKPVFLIVTVGDIGLEPIRYFYQCILNASRLPVSPISHNPDSDG